MFAEKTGTEIIFINCAFGASKHSVREKYFLHRVTFFEKVRWNTLQTWRIGRVAFETGRLRIH